MLFFYPSRWKTQTKNKNDWNQWVSNANIRAANHRNTCLKFQRRPERLLNALGMFNLRPCLRGYYIYTEVHMILDQLRQSSIYKYRFYLPRFEIVQKSWNRHCNSCLKFTLSLKKNSRSFHDLNITIGKTNHYSFQINNAAFILSRSS